MSGIKAFKAVYSYYMPEVQRVVDHVVAHYPHDVFLKSTDPGAGLDAFHEPIVARLVERLATAVPALGSFAHRYPTSGSEEGIRELLTKLAAQGEKRIFTWKGDYEGYREVAKTRGLTTVEVDFGVEGPGRVAAEERARGRAPGWWFLSNPSARDGNVLPRAVVEAVLSAGFSVFYDLSYLDATAPTTFDVSHPNVRAVVVSFSKPYGLFYYRVGFTFSKEPIDALYANKWFKNVLSLLIADRLMQEVPLGALPAKYKPAQARIVAELNREHGLGLVASDAFLLAHVPAADAARLPAAKLAELARFERDGNLRLCLTPYLRELEGRPE